MKYKNPTSTQINTKNEDSQPFTSAHDIVLAPGPVNLNPLVQECLSWPMIHHRTPEFDVIFKRVLSQLKWIFQTEQPVYISSSTGSGGMEALLVNLLSPGERVLGVDTGKFGERWIEMAETFGAQVHKIQCEWGQPVSIRQVADFLSQFPDTSLVLCQACETSTGTLNPIQEIGEYIHQYHPQTLFLVDGMTALGAIPLPMDAWKIDGLVAGSQKAFMLPTGLSFFSFSKRAWSRIPSAKCPRFYFDVRKEHKANQQGETFFSSNVTLIRALGLSLDLLQKKGLERHFSEVRALADWTRRVLPALGFSSYSQAPSDSITALKVPYHLDGQKIRSLVEKNYHITIMGGQDQAKGKIIRIGHMGYIRVEWMEALFVALHEVVSSELKNQTLDQTSSLKKETVHLISLEEFKNLIMTHMPFSKS